MDKKQLIICHGFDISSLKVPQNVSFAFLDKSTIHLVKYFHTNFDKIYIEDRLYCLDLDFPAETIPNLSKPKIFKKNLRVLLSACNDTHCNLFYKIFFKSCSKFVIPHPDNKDEGALKSLKAKKILPIILKYNQKISKSIRLFKSNTALCANDWCTEYRTLNSIIKKYKLGIFFSLQEGPQDWDGLIDGKKPTKYLNTDIFLSQGPATIKYIQPSYFSITGSPKSDILDFDGPPDKLCVLINCNFTYNNWEECRDQWLHDIISICEKYEINYLISQHPRDRGKIENPNLISSSTFKINEQLKSCSISISRFSNIPFESLKFGRHSIYYNPHGESPKSFNEDPTDGIFKAFNKEELKGILLKHKSDFTKINKKDIIETMEYHCGIQDGNSHDRIIKTMKTVLNNKVINKEVNKVLDL